MTGYTEFCDHDNRPAECPDCRVVLAAAARRTSWTAADLVAADFAEPRFAVDDLISEGLAFMCGAPKLGKSWLSVVIYSRCVGRGGLELSALQALRGILTDVRAAAGEVEGEVLFRTNFAGQEPTGPGVLIPASRLPSDHRGEDHTIRLSFSKRGGLELGDLPPEPPSGNGNGHHA